MAVILREKRYNGSFASLRKTGALSTIRAGQKGFSTLSVDSFRGVEYESLTQTSGYPARSCNPVTKDFCAKSIIQISSDEVLSSVNNGKLFVGARQRFRVANTENCYRYWAPFGCRCEVA